MSREYQPPVVRPKGSDDPAEGCSYDEYLQTEYWQIISRAARIMYGETCFRCDAEGARHVHHKYYSQNGVSVLGREDLLRGLEILCRKCHFGHHQGYKKNGSTSRKSTLLRDGQEND